ncbi:MAG: nucleotidyltransferase domain-containing protein [Candidatus Bathyarchaeota archaeon]|nr:nucleotidyltransferase domain-containing protein [Candidatus Bathyarchaeota archaeon]
MSLPDKVRSVLEPFIEDLKSRETTSGIGLFGSWSRGNAVPSSDIDFLIVENRDFDYERVERIEVNNCLVDLVYIPKRWILYGIPAEIDQKIYELQVLFDRDGSLKKARDLMAKVYWRPERVEIRTEAYLIGADTYLSRARLAFHRNDYQSVKVNSIRSFRSLMKILLEVGRKLISDSSFIRSLEDASKGLGMQSFYENYISISGLLGLDKANIKTMLNTLSSSWRGMINFIRGHSSFLKEAHPKIGAKINYYGREEFLKGLIARASSLVDESASIEAAHYIYHTFADALENYIYFTCIVEGVKFDYATIMKFLGESRKSPTEVFQGAADILGVKNISVQDAEKILKSVNEAAVNIRQRRKDLIMRFIS